MLQRIYGVLAQLRNTLSRGQPFLNILRGLMGSGLRILRTPRLVINAMILTLLTMAALSFVAWRVFAIGGGQVFDGTKAPGAHEWLMLNRDNVEAEFCGKCHAKIVNEVAATRSTGSHPIATCEGCHGVKTAGHGHVAVPRKCSDCHPQQASDLLQDAHASFITDIGESAERVSWSCKACHTKVEVDMQVTPIAPIRLILGGVNPTGGGPILTPTPAAVGSATPEAAGAQQGQVVFNNFCNACHPRARQGAGPAIAGLSVQQITAPVRNGKGAMPAFDQNKISDQQLNAMAAYVNTLR